MKRVLLMFGLTVPLLGALGAPASAACPYPGAFAEQVRQADSVWVGSVDGISGTRITVGVHKVLKGPAVTGSQMVLLTAAPSQSLVGARDVFTVKRQPDGTYALNRCGSPAPVDPYLAQARSTLGTGISKKLVAAIGALILIVVVVAVLVVRRRRAVRRAYY
jgi:hypothetical protein